jgi:hypothetical protein
VANVAQLGVRGADMQHERWEQPARPAVVLPGINDNPHAALGLVGGGVMRGGAARVAGGGRGGGAARVAGGAEVDGAAAEEEEG